MKIAIHHSKYSYSQYWIDYCEKAGIEYKIVDCYKSDIISQLVDCDALMWHHYHADFKDILTAKRILFALDHTGKKVFPDFKTGWHFDDKVAQKYLLESINAPLVPSYVFYDKNEAFEWAKKVSYPIVFKLKGGASAENVKLVKSQNDARNLIRKAFGNGFRYFNRYNNLKENYRKYRSGAEPVRGILNGVYRLFIPTTFSAQIGREKGYIYFQDYIPGNTFDTRIVVIGGEKAIAERRIVRENDFRASGSGIFSYDLIDLNAVSIAFRIAKQLELQMVAFDFIHDSESNPLIVEMSYGFGTSGISKAPGYWDKELNWHGEKFDLFEWMVQYLINSIENAQISNY